jgi:hypothetical protein
MKVWSETAGAAKSAGERRIFKSITFSREASHNILRRLEKLGWHNSCRKLRRIYTVDTSMCAMA